METIINKFFSKKVFISFLLLFSALNISCEEYLVWKWRPSGDADKSLLSQTKHPVPENFGNERVAEFYPIGWSKSANFAYMVYSQYPFKGGNWTLVIQNTKTDKILYSIGFEEEEDSPYIDNPVDSWPQIYRKVRRYLDRHQIEPQREFYKFRGISTLSGFDYKISYRKKTGVADMSYGRSEEIIGYRVKVYNGNRSKTITNYKIVNDALNGGSHLSDIAFFGAIESPFEDRIVVVTSFKIYDYQNDYAGTALAIAGCKLNTGFK